MGTLQLFLCVFLGHFIAVESVINAQRAAFPRHFPGFFGNMIPDPFERNVGFAPYDTMFSSWQTRSPDFHMLADFPPIMNVPRVEVFCDEAKLTLLVDKRFNGVVLTGEEMQLGEGCYSNGELPNQFVFTYRLDECGTACVMQNGFAMFTNSLHLNLKKPPPTWWQTPSIVHISCIPKRSYANPNFVPTFNIKAMNPSWTGAAESNVYKRGQVVNLQVSAKTRPEQQLFIQSCFISASPDPEATPRHAVIMNKGCTVPLGSPHAIIKFVASDRADVVNFVLNTFYLTSELYIHCSVLLSDQGVTFGSKSCNYDMIQSRWEDLSKTPEVCNCCSSKCKGLSVKRLPKDARAIVSTGPFVIVDKDVEMSPEALVSEPQESPSAPVLDSMQSDASNGAMTEDAIVSGSSTSRRKLSSAPKGVVVLRRDPVARLTLWQPGQLQDAEHGDSVVSESKDKLTVQLQASNTGSKDNAELQPSATDQESPLNTPTNKIGDENLDFVTLNWIIPLQLEKAAVIKDAKRKTWLGRLGLFGIEAPQEDSIPLPDEMNILDQNDFNKVRDQVVQRQVDATVTPQEETNDVRPVIRSKLQFSKSSDGSQTLSYEEDVVTQQEGEGRMKRFGMDGTKRKLCSTFLDLLRRLDKAE